ncbi:type II toxin-antitoxin system HicA family toxin [Methanolapillus ohkumae]|uniref:Type II toxin-antitoxin system HicA family toxin n=1 Tax=Methanolapillus ohkumae TaxID=3028298 RepID=A0AA96ZUY7_9EURY|nr:hypothetical protein MsAm2_00300 [Methanosarcinaceae archaeon Am2]
MRRKRTSFRSYKTREIESALVKKGFVEDRKRGHKHYIYYYNGKKMEISTIVSHGVKEYGRDLIMEMKRQLFLTRPQFDNLVQCPLTKEELREIYKKKGRLPTT